MIKRITLFVALFMGCLAYMNAQNSIFEEDWSGVTTNDGHGAVPSDWTLHNDGETIASDLSSAGFDFFQDNAWEIMALNGGENVAMAISWYANPVAADRWLVSPEISIPEDGGSVLQFSDLSALVGVSDEYEIRISTSGTDKSDFGDPIFTATPQYGYFTDREVSLKDYTGQDIHIAFVDVQVDGGDVSIGRIKVLQYEGIDLSAEAINIDPYIEDGNQTINATVTNVGGEDITSFDATWSVDGGTDHTQTFDNISLGATDTYDFDFDDQWNASAGEHTITVVVSNVNNDGSDDDTSNDSVESSVSVVSEMINKKVVIEEGTGTWCGYCPRGIVAMEHFYDNHEQYPDFIGIAVHNQDPMMVSEYDSGAAFSSFPGSNVNRVLLGEEVGTDVWESIYNDRKDLVAPASVSVSGEYDFATKGLTIDVAANFVADISNANMRFAVVLVEDNVSGTTSDWGQSNYYSGGSLGPMGGFEDLPQTVPASDIAYNRVGRALLGGYDGAEGSVPSSIADGDEVTYQFTYTLDDIKQEDLSIVALLIDNNTGEIINADEIAYTDLVLGVDKHEVANSFELYPNPASDVVNLTFGEDMGGDAQLKIYDLNGKLIKTQDYNDLRANSQISVDVSNLSSGEYLISVSNAQGAVVKKLVIK